MGWMFLIVAVAVAIIVFDHMGMNDQDRRDNDYRDDPDL